MRRFKYFLLAALLLCLSGCQLAQPEAQTQADMLVGVMLTPEPLDLFDWEGYVGDRFGQADGEVSAADAADYAQRLYATRVDEGRWQFEGVEGFAFFAASYESESGTVSAVQNDGLADGSYAVHERDEGSDCDIAATLYVRPEVRFAWYFNPVYQTESGEVYLTAGQGMSFAGDNSPGMSASQTFSGTRSYTGPDGQRTDSTSCAITVEIRALPEQLRIFWMDAENRILRQESWTPDALPDSIDPGDAAWLLVEEQSGGTVTRTLCQPGDGNLRAWTPGEMDTIQPVDIPVSWPEESEE